MKKFWKIAGIALAVMILGVTAVGAVAFAQDSEDGATWPFNFRDRFRDVIAGVLGISVEEYDAAVETAQGQVLDQALDEGWLTEEQAEQMRERMAEGVGPGMRGGKFGHSGRGMMGGKENSFIDVAADALDMTAEDLVAELQEGKTVAEIAEEKGVDPQEIADAFLAQLAETLNEAVTDGKLTQERADWMLEQATEKVQEHLYEPFDFEGRGQEGHRRGGPRMRPGGGFHGFPGEAEGSSS